jgi:hypothetical protein
MKGGPGDTTDEAFGWQVGAGHNLNLAALPRIRLRIVVLMRGIVFTRNVNTDVLNGRSPVNPGGDVRITVVPL